MQSAQESKIRIAKRRECNIFQKAHARWMYISISFYPVLVKDAVLTTTATQATVGSYFL